MHGRKAGFAGSDPVRGLPRAMRAWRGLLRGQALFSVFQSGPRDRFQEYSLRVWDEQIERNVREGLLDDLVDRALVEHRAGRTRPL